MFLQATIQADGKHLRLGYVLLDAAMRGRSSDVATMSAVEYH